MSLLLELGTEPDSSNLGFADVDYPWLVDPTKLLGWDNFTQTGRATLANSAPDVTSNGGSWDSSVQFPCTPPAGGDDGYVSGSGATNAQKYDTGIIDNSVSALVEWGSGNAGVVGICNTFVDNNNMFRFGLTTTGLILQSWSGGAPTAIAPVAAQPASFLFAPVVGRKYLLCSTRNGHSGTAADGYSVGAAYLDANNIPILIGTLSGTLAAPVALQAATKVGMHTTNATHRIRRMAWGTP